MALNPDSFIEAHSAIFGGHFKSTFPAGILSLTGGFIVCVSKIAAKMSLA